MMACPTCHDERMADRPVTFSTGIPETVLDLEPATALVGIAAALDEPDLEKRRAMLGAVIAAHPRCLDGWAQLSRIGRDPAERYAYARVGYHRGLDRLRASGWRGSGYVRWRHETNRGFLRALDALRGAAQEIAEHDEQDRCALFLLQLDPDWERRADQD
jgi:Protein of unknown function (DUF3151)